MAEQVDDFDDARYQHHLLHRGITNHMIFWMFWILVATTLFICAIQRIFVQRRAKRSDVRGVQRNYASPSPVRSSRRNPARAGPDTLRERMTMRLNVSLTLPLAPWLDRVLPKYTLGRLLVLGIYTSTIMALLCLVGAPFMSQHFIDDVAFRAAWITITQIPLVYLLSAKRGPFKLLANFSYEHANWIHRWTGRILFICATTHAAIMKSSIAIEDILRSRDSSMSVVRYGIGAYGTLIWIVLTSILPLRRWSYRIFYINHYIASFGFLLIALQHAPSYARTAIYMAMFFTLLDRALVAFDFVRLNFSVMSRRNRFLRYKSGSGRGRLVAGYQIEMVAAPLAALALPNQTKDHTTIIRVLKVPLMWKPGQHIRLYIPALGAFEMHPFTPANASAIPAPPLPQRRDVESHGHMSLPQTPKQKSDMLFTIRAHSGLTSRLADYHLRWLANPCPNSSHSEQHLVGFIDGPYGTPPTWESYENLVLIGASTGVSFLLSIMDFLEQVCFTGKSIPSTRMVTFVWVMRHCDPHLEHMTEDLLSRYSTVLHENGIQSKAEFYITCPESHESMELTQYDPFAHLRQYKASSLSQKPPLKIRNPEEIYSEWDREAEEETRRFKQMNASVTDLGSDESYTFESDDEDEISEVDTLVDESGDDGQENDPFADTHAIHAHDDAYRPLPAPGPERQDEARPAQTADLRCQCAIIQQQKRKLKTNSKGSQFIRRHSAIRPDIKRIISDAVDHDDFERTMVAVCANSSIARQAQLSVAMMKKQALREHSSQSVDIFVEGGMS